MPLIGLPAGPVTMLSRWVDRADGRSIWFHWLFVENAGAALECIGRKMGISKAAA
jgi:hypothetical protein